MAEEVFSNDAQTVVSVLSQLSRPCLTLIGPLRPVSQ